MRLRHIALFLFAFLFSSCAIQPPKEIRESGSPYFAVATFDLGPLTRYTYLSYWPGDQQDRQIDFVALGDGGSDDWKWAMSADRSLLDAPEFDQQELTNTWESMWVNLRENRWLFGDDPPALALEIQWIPEGQYYETRYSDWVLGEGPIKMRVPYHFVKTDDATVKGQLNRTLAFAMHEYAHAADDRHPSDAVNDEARSYGIALCADFFADGSLDGQVSEDFEQLSFYEEISRNPNHARILEILDNSTPTMIGANIIQFNVIKVLGTSTFDAGSQHETQFRAFCERLASMPHDFRKGFLELADR